MFAKSRVQHPSLIRRALVWCGATLALFCVMTALGSFVVGYESAREHQDRILKEVVGIVSRDVVRQQLREEYKAKLKGLTIGGFYGPGSSLGPSIEEADRAALTMDDSQFEDNFELDGDDSDARTVAGETVLVRLLHKRGRAVAVTFTEDYTDGPHTVRIFDESYRVYIRTLADGTHVAAGQRLSERNRIILNAALTSAAPILILAPVMLLVLLFALWRALAPLKRLEAEVNARCGSEKAPLSDNDIPGEVAGLVAAFNGLMQRLDELRRREARFTADAAHELRSPLTALSLQAEQLSRCPMSAQAAEKLADMRRALERAVTLVNQLLAFKRAQAAEGGALATASVGCVEALSGVLEDLWWQAQDKEQTLAVTGLEEASVSEARIGMRAQDFKSLIGNLVQNAVRYTPEKGSVTIAVVCDDKSVTVSVADTGPGIDEAERERVFDPFYRVLGSGEQGTGLGLAIAKTVAVQTGSTIALGWTDAVERTGLTATVVMPRAPK